MLLWMVLLLGIIPSSQQITYLCNSSASCGCSTNPVTLTRIVGGESAVANTWGWAVSLFISSSSLCGGSILSDSWIITAAHCVNRISASKIIIYAGSTIRFSGIQSRVVTNVIVHPSYNPSTYFNDIALLRLGTPFIMTDSAVSTICLPTVNSTTLAAGEWPAVNTSVVAIGWGRLNESGSLSLTLQQVTLLTIYYGASTCAPLMTDWQKQLCAGVYGGGKDTCQGDSGGPLMIFTASNQWVLVGLTSSGVGCAQATYSGLYTRVAAYQDWINSTMSATYSDTGTTDHASFLVLSSFLSTFYMMMRY